MKTKNYNVLFYNILKPKLKNFVIRANSKNKAEVKAIKKLENPVKWELIATTEIKLPDPKLNKPSRLSRQFQNETEHFLCFCNDENGIYKNEVCQRNEN